MLAHLLQHTPGGASRGWVPPRVCYMSSSAVTGTHLKLLVVCTTPPPHDLPPLQRPAGNMGTWFDTSALVTSVRNFPNDRGFVVGVLKSFLGLSSSLYTSVYAW